MRNSLVLLGVALLSHMGPCVSSAPPDEILPASLRPNGMIFIQFSFENHQNNLDSQEADYLLFFQRYHKNKNEQIRILV